MPPLIHNTDTMTSNGIILYAYLTGVFTGAFLTLFINLYFKKNNMPKHELPELETKTAWLIGSKLPGEPSFFTQLVFTVAHKQRMWTMFLQNGNDYYITEIQIPFCIKDVVNEPLTLSDARKA